MTSSIPTSETDVLVVGAGPAGLIASWWIARCGLGVRVVDKDPNALLHGRADGMRARLVEMFDSMGYGLQESVLKESFPLLKSASWLRDANGHIQRVEQLPLYEDHRRPLVTPYQPAALSQGRIEQLIQRAISDVSDGKVRVERGREAVSLVIEKELANDADAFPIAITLQDSDKGFSANSKYNGSATITTPDWHNEDKPATTNGTSDPEGKHTASNPETNGETRNLETIRAKYVIGCDGARSWLRKQLGFKTEGSHTNTVWVALDIYPLTDFPDVRRPTGVQTTYGTTLMIPREKGLLRIYIPFGEDGKDATRAGVTLEQARTRVKEAFQPYQFDFEKCQWWSAYSLGQRYTETATHAETARIFLCGDALHNNSPLIGLGLNVSAQDAWNLGWKIALAVSAPSQLNRRAFLDSYETERLPVAKRLVWYDRNWTTLFNKALVEPGVIIQRYHEFRNFSDSYILEYPDSALVSRSLSTQTASSNLLVGESFTHARVVMQADGQTYWTSARLKAKGQFHIVLLAGDIGAKEQKNRVDGFCDQLLNRNQGKSLLYDRYPYCFPTEASDYDRSDVDRGREASMINLIAIHTSAKDHPLLEFHEAMRGPNHSRFGWDASKVMADIEVPYDRYCDGTAYSTWGVDRTKGAVVVLRPDLHIGWIGNLEDYAQLEKFFEGALGQAWDVSGGKILP